MKRMSTFAVSLILVAMAACSGSSPTNTPSTTQPTPTNSPCTFAISPSTGDFATSGGSQVIRVSASPSGCAPSAWSASTASATLSVAPTSGSGNGTVTVTASPNTTAVQQTLTATIAGQTFTATVAPVGCTYTFSANRANQNGNTWIVSSDASQEGVTVTVVPNDGSCAPWRVASDADWITVSPTSGTTSTTVAMNYTANNTANARVGNVSFLRPGCSGSDCESTVALNQAGRSTFALSVTLLQGENLSGPYGGIVTGPNGFSCSLPQLSQSTSCAPATFRAGTTATLLITLTQGVPGDTPNAGALGCDSQSRDSCTVTMASDRSVTIHIGCALCDGLIPETADAVVETRLALWPTPGSRFQFKMIE